MFDMRTLRRLALASLVGVLWNASASAATINTWGRVTLVYPGASSADIYFQLEVTAGVNCVQTPGYYYIVPGANASTDRWFSLLTTSLLTGKKIWLQIDDAQCGANKSARAMYAILLRD